MARRSIFLLTVFFIVFLCVPHTLFAKTTGPSYRYNRISEQFEIQSDGSVKVTELLTMLYDGTYHSMWRVLPVGTSTTVSNIEVLDGATGAPLTFSASALTPDDPASWGKYTTQNENGATNISWAYSTPDRVHTWVLHYTLHGALTFLGDHDELFWTLFSNYTVPVDTMELEISLPRPVTSPRASIFTSGGHDYYIDRPDAKTFRFRVSDIAIGERAVIKIGWEKGLVHPHVLWPLIVLAFAAYKWLIASVLGLLGTLAALYYMYVRKRKLGKTLFFLILCTGLLIPHVSFADNSSASYQVWGPMILPGGYATSTNFSLLGTLTEFASNILSNSASYLSNTGFVAYPFVTTPVVSASAGANKVDLTWTAAQGYLGFSVSGYSVGQSTSSGGPYTYTAVGNVLAYTASSLTAGTPYYFLLRVLDAFGATIATSTEISATPTAPVTPPPPPPPPGGGGGGGGGGGYVPPEVIVGTSQGAKVIFEGHAYPNSRVVLMKDGQKAAETVAGGDARFSIQLANLSGGDYVFSVYGIDASGKQSPALSFPEMLTNGVTTTVSGIFISPTIDVDKEQVKKGENVAIFGRSAASSTVTISVHSNPEMFVRTPADKDGAYLYNFDTVVLDYGGHLAKSKATLQNEISNFGASVGFAVGDTTILKKPTGVCIPPDLNCDGYVNLVDFSIMAYWYKRPLTGRGIRADLNHDGSISLADFSILVYYWTG